MYTEKQKELLDDFKNGELKRLNILQGSVRSGKTWISLVLWAFWVVTMPRDANYLMCAKTLTSLKRNCLDLLEVLVGKKNFTYSVSKKEAILFGRRIYLEGANDARSESKIRGLTLAGAYCDELTQFPEDFFNMLLSRLSVSGAKLFGTTNPDKPTHWLKVKFMDNEKIESKYIAKFLLDDNTTLDKEYIENLKKEYTGVFYERFILGNWVTAEGAIYLIYANNPEAYSIKRENVPKLLYINVGVDIGGNKSNHAIVATGIDESMNVYVLKSLSLKATGKGVQYILQKTKELCEETEREYGFIDCVYPDNAEQAIVNTISAALKWNVRGCYKCNIIDRIRCTDLLLSTHRLFLVEGENAALDKGLKEAVWSDKEDDKRLDDGTSDIDVLDAFEYSFEKFIKQLTREEYK